MFKDDETILFSRNNLIMIISVSFPLSSQIIFQHNYGNFNLFHFEPYGKEYYKFFMVKDGSNPLFKVIDENGEELISDELPLNSTF